MTDHERAWRDYCADVSATRREALRKLAPSTPPPKLSPRAAAALARARKRTHKHS